MANIVIIDDDVEIASNTAAIMRKEGHTVSMLHMIENAVRVLGEDRPDLVILDVMFPDNPVAGFDLARQIRRNKATRRIPIILLTGVNQHFPAEFSAKDIDPDWMPVQDFIEKPAKADVLIRTVNRLLKKG
jgi:DNA-binding response OmpR family regulator